MLSREAFGADITEGEGEGSVMGYRHKGHVPAHGWGAAEILRSLHEDARRYRRPGKPSSERDPAHGEESADTIRDHRRPES